MCAGAGMLAGTLTGAWHARTSNRRMASRMLNIRQGTVRLQVQLTWAYRHENCMYNSVRHLYAYIILQQQDA